MNVHQVLSGAGPYDAVTNEALDFRARFTAWGWGGRWPPPPSDPPSDPGPASGWSRNAGRIKAAATTNPRRCIPAIISIS